MSEWKEVAQLHALAQLNLDLAVAELKRCEEELDKCLAQLRQALEKTQEAKS